MPARSRRLRNSQPTQAAGRLFAHGRPPPQAGRKAGSGRVVLFSPLLSMSPCPADWRSSPSGEAKSRILVALLISCWAGQGKHKAPLNEEWGQETSSLQAGSVSLMR